MAEIAPGDKLIVAVRAIDWSANLEAFARASDLKDQVAICNLRLAVWSKQLENADKGNQALTFVREMQVQGHYAAALLAIGLYKPAAAAMRGMFDSALYYTFFRSHPVELDTLVRSHDFFLDKRTILDFHRRHTPDFQTKQDSLGLVSRVEAWYAEVSAIVHGQMPGKWTTHEQLAELAFSKLLATEAVSMLARGEAVVHRLFLSTVSSSTWHGFSTAAKKELLKGMTPLAKRALALATA